MPRKRMIDPSFWRDEKIAECTRDERLLFIGLWNFAEDHGVGRANPKLIKADIFPYDTLRDSDIEKALTHLAELALIVLFESDSQKYYYISNFKKHQTINKPTPPTLPLPDDYGSATAVLPPKLREEKLSEVKLSEVEDEESKKRKKQKHTYGEFEHVSMNEGEYEKLISKYPKSLVDDKIASLDSNIQSGIKKYIVYTDHYATIGNWCRKDSKEAVTEKDYGENGIQTWT